MNSAWPLAASPAGVGDCADAIALAPSSSTQERSVLFIAMSLVSSASLGDDIDQHRLAGLHDPDRLLERGREIARIGDRPERGDAETFRHRGVVDKGIAQGDADIGAVDAALAPVGHALDAHDLLMIGTVVV